MGMARKLKRAKKQNNLDMKSVMGKLKGLNGLSDNGLGSDSNLISMLQTQMYGSVDNPHFPSFKNEGRVRDLRLDEEGLLAKFSNNYFKESFEIIQKYVERHEYIRSMCYMKDSLIDIDMIEICLTEQELKEFFSWQYDYCVDRINYIIDIIEYSKNKSYKKILKRFEDNFSKIIDTSKMDLMSFAQNTINILRDIQTRYVDSAPYIATVYKLKTDKYVDLIASYERYNTEMIKSGRDSITKSLNQISNGRNALDKDLVARIEKVSLIYTKKSLRIEKVDTGVNDKTDYDKKIEKLISKIEAIDIIGDKFLNENGTFNYSSAVNYSKSSKDSVEKIIKIELNKYEKIYSIINSIFELSLLFIMRESVKENKNLKQMVESEYQNNTIKLYKKYIGDFYVFTIKESVNISKKQDYDRLNEKFLKKIQKLYSK